MSSPKTVEAHNAPLTGKAESTVVPMSADQKAGLLLAISQLDMLVMAFGNAPEKIKESAKNFRDTLQEWADGKI